MQKFIHSSKNGGFAYCYLAPQVDEHLAAVGASTQGLLNRIAELESALRYVMSDADRGFGMPDAVKQTIASLMGSSSHE